MKGIHTPLITKDTYNKVQKIFISKPKSNFKQREFMFTGLIVRGYRMEKNELIQNLSNNYSCIDKRLCEV